MITWSPRETRLAVSSDLANPRKPPTPVRPAASAAWAGRAPLPSVKLVGEETACEFGDAEVKASDVDTFGAGRTATSATAATATRAPAATRDRHGTPFVSDNDCHMATSPHTPQPTQARTQAPNARSTDWAAATATRAVDPANE